MHYSKQNTTDSTSLTCLIKNLFQSDVGSPLFFNNEFVGVILRVEQNYALAVSVFGTRTEVGIGETTVPNYYPLRSDTVYKRRRV